MGSRSPVRLLRSSGVCTAPRSMSRMELIALLTESLSRESEPRMQPGEGWQRSSDRRDGLSNLSSSSSWSDLQPGHMLAKIL